MLFVKEIFNAGIGVDETISYYTPMKLLKKELFQMSNFNKQYGHSQVNRNNTFLPLNH